MDIMAKINTAFAGTITVPQMKVGYTGYLDVLIPLQPIGKAGQLKIGKQRQLFCEGMSTPWNVTDPIICTIQNTTGNLSAYTAGEVEIILVYATKPVR